MVAGQCGAWGWPDAENRLAKAVELRGVDDVGEIVVEHTRIESYDS